MGPTCTYNSTGVLLHHFVYSSVDYCGVYVYKEVTLTSSKYSLLMIHDSVCISLLVGVIKSWQST